MNLKHKQDICFVVLCLSLTLFTVASSSVPQDFSDGGFGGGFGGVFRPRMLGDRSCKMDNVCPRGWVPYKGHCYLINSTSDVLFNQKGMCIDNHSYLLRIDSKEEYDFIVGQLLATGITDNMFTGGTDLVSSGTFQWISTGEAFNPTDYDSTFAASPSGNCITLVKDTTWGLEDLSCTANAGYICEADALCFVTEEDEEE